MDIGLIAVHGPSSRKILQSLVKQDISTLRFYHIIDGVEITNAEVKKGLQKHLFNLTKGKRKVELT